MKKETDLDTMTDDEIREVGFSDGNKNVGKHTLRPITALSMSWMYRNNVFSDEDRDILQRTAAFAYLHAADRDDIRSVVNSKDKFWSAVDDWIEANIEHHTDLEPYSSTMNEALQTYMAAKSEPIAKGGKAKGARSKNT